MGMEHLPLRSTFLTVIPAILGFYAFYNLLFDKYLVQKKLLNLFAFGVLTATLSGIIGGICMEGLAHLNFGKTLFNDGWNSASAITTMLAFVALLNGGMGLLLRGFITWYDELQNKLELQKKTSM
jgi:hypothetical protein